jgi:hydroxyacylglutathione hydrolase
MFFRLLYEDDLSHASYLIGCQRTGEAIVIDPLRDVDRYDRAAAAGKLRIVAAADTHIHADYLSGLREFAARGVRVYASGCGGTGWSPAWFGAGHAGAAVLLASGDEIRVGGVRLIARHTPGHTPEHVSYEVYEAGADDAIGIATGDFVFVGDVGRPDLLETAVGVPGSARPAALELQRSLAWFASLPDHLQVWPGHGAGSACGKDLGSVPQSTVGYERRHNPALRSSANAPAFADAILADQPESPPYFARMKRMNVEGPAVIGAAPPPPRLTAAAIPEASDRTRLLLDLRPWAAFRAAHVPGSLHAELDEIFTVTTASYIAPETGVVLVSDDPAAAEAARRLRRVGIDRVLGRLSPEDIASYATKSIAEIPAGDAAAVSGPVLDVRRAAEFAGGHATGARNIAHTQLALHTGELAPGSVVHVMCKTGRRSARASAMLARAGFKPVNLAGGFPAYAAAGGAVVGPTRS